MEKVPPKPKKLKGATREDLSKLNKDELIDKILQLEAHNLQLKNIISRNSNDTEETSNKRKRPFDFAKCHYRRVLLRILYFGWDYQGLAVQEDSTQTIEHHLFHALTKACLIESRETSQYHRCGRTDKGVSAFGQVISITLRSNQPPEEQTSEESVKAEMPYCKILNRLLPKEIRAVSWLPLSDDKKDFSARFDCKQRLYKYYFPRSNLDIPAMRAASRHLVGSHDFRHLCKMDVGNGVVEFTREIFGVDISRVGEGDGLGGDGPTSMYCLKIWGNAFLWHQIRCIVGVLLLVGQGKEQPSVVAELLDVEKVTRKPQYNMALDLPLNLFQCTYDIESEVPWHYDADELRCVITHLQNEWTLHSIKTTMIQDCLRQLEAQYATCMKERKDTEVDGEEGDSIMAHTDCLLQGVKPKTYVALLDRVTCSSLEERIEFFKKKRKLN